MSEDQRVVTLPTVGRTVYYRPVQNEFPASNGGIQPAIITEVWNKGCVNLAVFDANGNLHNRTSVKFVQDGEEPGQDGGYAHWMPYQINKAREDAQEPQTAEHDTS